MSVVARIAPSDFDDGIPIPRRSRYSNGDLRFGAMKDGQSKFFTEQRAADTFYHALNNYLRNSPSKALIRKMGGGWRVWKVAR